MNKKIVGAVAVAIIIIVGGYFGYQYLQKGTVAYSLAQLKMALVAHDNSTASQYINTDAIWNNVWPRVEAKALTANNLQNNAGLTLAGDVLTSQEGDMQSLFENAVYNATRGTTGDPLTSALTNVFSALSQQGNIVTNGSSATLTLNYQEGTNYPIYQFGFVFTQQPNRSWAITDIQGLEDYLWSANDDQTRVNDLEQIAFQLNYWKNIDITDSICGCTAAQNQIDNCQAANACLSKFIATSPDQEPYPSFNSYSSLVGFLGSWKSPDGAYDFSNTKLPNDPLSRYGNNYYYATNASGTEYVLKADLSDPNSPLFLNLPSNILDSHVLYAEGTYLGLDCHKPAYCIASRSLIDQLGVQSTNMD